MLTIDAPNLLSIDTSVSEPATYAVIGKGGQMVVSLNTIRSSLKPIDKYMPYIDSFQISKKLLPGCFFEWSDFEWKTSPFPAPKSLQNVAILPDHSLLKFERSPSVDRAEQDALSIFFLFAFIR